MSTHTVIAAIMVAFAAGQANAMRIMRGWSLAKFIRTWLVLSLVYLSFQDFLEWVR